MSETLVGSPAGVIYGTYADAVIYIDAKLGDSYRAWETLSVPDRKRALLSAAAYINQQIWIDEADTFAERDAIQAFKDASYELGVLIAVDPDLVALVDQGTNIAAAGAGGAYVQFANPTSAKTGSAPLLPPIIMRLLGAYLSSGALSTASGGLGVAGGCRNPLSECSDYDWTEPK